MAQSQNPQRPVHEVRYGRVKAAVWENRTSGGTRHNVTVCRIYKDDESGQWRDSQSFGRDDLLPARQGGRRSPHLDLPGGRLSRRRRFRFAA